MVKPMMSLTTRLGKIRVLRSPWHISVARSLPTRATVAAYKASISCLISGPHDGIQRAIGRPHGVPPPTASETAWPLPRLRTRPKPWPV